MIPKSFYLGGRRWNVVYLDQIDKGDSYAKWLDNKAEIQIAKNIQDDNVLDPCDDYQLEHSFWHELGHIFQYYSTGHTDDSFAQTFATFMMEFNKSKE